MSQRGLWKVTSDRWLPRRHGQPRAAREPGRYPASDLAGQLGLAHPAGPVTVTSRHSPGRLAT
jgi:hypothetical protein